MKSNRSFSAELAQSENLPWFGAALLLITVLLLGNLPLITGGAAPIWDAVDYYGPFLSLVGDHVRHARLMLWDPWINAGAPDFADPQTGAASPFFLICAALFSNPLHGFVVFWISFWAFGGIGMLLLCKHLQCPPWGGLIAALSFVASGFYSSHGEHTAILYSYSFFPAILWRFDAGLVERRFLPMIEAGVLWGFSGLGGYPQLTILEPLFLALWALSVYTTCPAARKKAAHTMFDHAKFPILAFVLFGTVGAAVMSPTYISFLVEGAGYTARANPLARAYALNSNLLPPKALSTFGSPILYLLDLPPSNVWPGSDVTMVNCYVGALAAVLAIGALVTFSKRRLFIAGIGLFFLACAFGGDLPVRGWLYDLVPPTRYFRHPALFRCFTMFAVAILAALGTVDIRRAEQTRNTSGRLPFLLTSLFFLPLAYLSFRQIYTPHVAVQQFSFAPIHFWVTWTSIAIVMTLWVAKVVRGRDLCWSLLLIAAFDACSALYLSSPTIYSKDTVTWWQAMGAQHDSALDLGAQGLNRRLQPPANLGPYSHDRNLALKDPELSNISGLTSRIFEAFVRDTLLRQIALGPNRFWFSSAPAWCQPDQGSFSEFSSESHRLGFPTMVLHTRAAMIANFDRPDTNGAGTKPDCLRDASVLLPAPIELLKYTPNALSISFRSSQKGWLLITDRWALSWVATVNGKRTPILGADFLFRAVPVNAGNNDIAMNYSPREYIPLIVVSWGTILGLLVWEIWRFLQLGFLRPQSPEIGCLRLE